MVSVTNDFLTNYLQPTGLCLPSVSSHFERNNRQVVSLGKGGGAGFIYILASVALPGCSDSKVTI